MTERVLKILNSTYSKAKLDDVAADAVQLDTNKRENLLVLIKEFDDLFDVTLVKRDTFQINLEVNPVSKQLHARYDPVPRLNMEVFHKQLLWLVEIGVVTPIHKSEYGTPNFIIPKMEVTISFIIDYW